MNKDNYTSSTATCCNQYGFLGNYNNCKPWNSTCSPSPATAMPQIFCKFKPHCMPNPVLYVKESLCVPYKSLSTYNTSGYFL